jgi:hypothetical protein
MRRPMSIVPVVVASLAVALPVAHVAPTAASTFNISITYGNGITAGEKTVFGQAASYWESVITGYNPVLAPYSEGVAIDASARAIDGVGGVLGSTWVSETLAVGQYTVPLSAWLRFDTADLDNMYNQGYLYQVILHEMGHAMGFGVVWTDDGIYVNGTGHYTGAAALAAYRSEFVGKSAAAYVPVELGGGAGTADAHWDENTGGSGATGIVDARNRDMQFELMTGWLNLPASKLFVSQTTIHQFEDLGYTVAQVLGDANLDGFVDGADLNIVLSNYNQTGMDWAHGDFNGDTTVNGADLNTVLSNYGDNNGIPVYGEGGGASLSMAVPEPGTLGLSALGALLVLAWAARRRATCLTRK